MQLIFTKKSGCLASARKVLKNFKRDKLIKLMLHFWNNFLCIKSTALEH